MSGPQGRDLPQAPGHAVHEEGHPNQEPPQEGVRDEVSRPAEEDRVMTIPEIRV